MAPGDIFTLKRDCGATVIPGGLPVQLTAGTAVTVTQALGGTFTVLWEGNLVRIDARDADALGLEVTPPAAGPGSATAHTGPVDEELIWDRMRTVFDPEIPVNIVDLGLIYDCRIVPQENGGSRVEVRMTLTAPGCGMSEVLRADVENRVREVPGVTDVQVEVVWDPPWNQSMMTEAARLELGFM